MGFNYVSEVSTPDSKAASEDAVISVANIFTFVKNRDGSYEANLHVMEAMKQTEHFV